MFGIPDFLSVDAGVSVQKWRHFPALQHIVVLRKKSAKNLVVQDRCRSRSLKSSQLFTLEKLCSYITVEANSPVNLFLLKT